jgi:hypothetical protein
MGLLTGCFGLKEFVVSEKRRRQSFLTDWRCLDAHRWAWQLVIEE